MSRTFAKLVIRVLGTLAGLMGIWTLCITGFLLADVYSQRFLLLLIPFLVFSGAVAAYFVYVAYLVWFRFSPLAVRHACGALGLYVLIFVLKFSDPSRDSFAPWTIPAFPAFLVAVYLGYRGASSWLSRWLFPETGPGVQR